MRVYDEGDTIVIVDAIPIYLTGEVTLYESTMTGNETYAAPASGIRTIAILDPNGADRNFNPSGDFPDGFEIVVVNKGANNITVDSAGCAKTLAFGEIKSIFFDGTNWN